MTRVFDVVVATIGIVVLLPVFAAIALAVKLGDGGPVFYFARRMGKGGREFRLAKFRTMCVNADAVGPGITRDADPRVTSVGRFLRATKLDELPQLWNVLKGEMSLVGPRPEDPRYVARYTDQQRDILDFRPGITSAASLEFRHEEQMLVGTDWEQAYLGHIMPAKIEIDLAYMRRRNLLTDVGLILRTALAMLKRHPGDS